MSAAERARKVLDGFEADRRKGHIRDGRYAYWCARMEKALRELLAEITGDAQ